MEQARRWYDCEEYKPWKEARLKAAVTNIILVEGM